jgi:hypothetical protein
VQNEYKEQLENMFSLIWKYYLIKIMVLVRNLEGYLQLKVYQKDVMIIVIYKRTFYLGIEMGIKNVNFNEIHYKEDCNLQGYI